MRFGDIISTTDCRQNIWVVAIACVILTLARVGNQLIDDKTVAVIVTQEQTWRHGAIDSVQCALYSYL